MSDRTADRLEAIRAELRRGKAVAELWYFADHIWRAGDRAAEVLGPRPADIIRPQPAGQPAVVAMPRPAVVPCCIHLGPAAPNQPGVPCGQRVRACDEFGTCTVGPCSDPSRAHCLDAQGRPACPEYIPRET